MDSPSLRFCKMHGLGNDFLVADNRAGRLRFAPAQVRAWGDRHTGVGFDQMLVAEAPREVGADFSVRIFNRDGSEAGQCGNGMRCMALFARRGGLSEGEETRMEAPGGLVRARFRGDLVTVSMGVPSFAPDAVPFLAEEEQSAHVLELGDGDRVSVGVVSMGNPHAVLWVGEVDRVPVRETGARVQECGRFPRGVNVSFAERVAPTRIRLRVYERGAGETRACGTGACAAAVVGMRRGELAPEVRVDLPGGWLRVEWPGAEEPVWLTGEATHVFDGELRL